MLLESLVHVMEELIPFNKFLGLKCLAAEKGMARIEVPYRPELVGDPFRPALHGGVIGMLIDTVGGMAIWAQLEGERSRVSTIDLRIDYLRPAKLESLIGEARVVRVGNRVGVVDVNVYQPSLPGEIIATGKGVYNVKLVKS